MKNQISLGASVPGVQSPTNDKPTGCDEADRGWRAETLHVYSPYTWHDEAAIVGTRGALLALRSAIDAAISEGEASFLAFTADGEGFAGIVVARPHEEIDRLALPYTDDLSRGGYGLNWADLVPVERYRALARPSRTHPSQPASEAVNATVPCGAGGRNDG